MINITKQNLKDYPYLLRVIEQDKAKLQHYKDNPPIAIHGKVTGSNSVFPYQLRSFTVSGPEFADERAWKEKVRYLEVKLKTEINLYERIKLEIDNALARIPNPRLKLIIEYTLQGKSQEWIGEKVYLDRSRISREIDKFIKIINKEQQSTESTFCK